MAKEMIISTSPHETKVALLEEGQAVEIYVEREKEVGLVGSIYKGRVTRVLPGMQSAFIDIGLERDAFLYVSDFFENLEEYEQVVAPEAEAPAEEPAPPAAEETAEAAPSEETAPVAESKPAPTQAEPPLRLPERQPGNRRRRRSRRPRRSGRSRGPFRDRGPRRRPQMSSPPSPDPDSGADREIVLLPGESLAKYRGRNPAPPEKLEPEQQSAEKREDNPPELSPEQTGNGPVPPIGDPPESGDAPNAPESAAAPSEPKEEHNSEPPPATAPESGASGSEPSPAQADEQQPAEPPAAQEPTEQEPAREETPSSPAEATTPETSQPAAAGTMTPAAGLESYPDATALAEIQRVRRYEQEVGLPPSVQERTGGGVEWGTKRNRRGRRPRRGERRPRRGYRTDRQRRGGRRITPARPSRGQPPIAELLRPGQEIIVQIAKEQIGKKGARITSHITLPGRFLVYMPTIEHIGISRKIASSSERNRLRRLLLDLKGTVSGGFVVRTAAAGSSDEDLRQDIDYLVKLWHDIRVRADEGKAPALLHNDLNLVERLLRDQLTPDYQSIWVDSEEEYAKVVEFISHFQPALTNRAKLYTRPTPVFEEMGVQQEIDRALKPKVWLKSGGYIVINHTEALVAIDVNTGKFVGKGSTRLEDTIVKTNLDAVREIVRQIRLRDLGGIIIIDFIDMEDSRNRNKVMRALEEELRTDRSPSKLLSFNEFGLVAITRKRSRQSLERVLCQPCPYCTGTGMVKSLETLCFEIQGEARKLAESIDAPELTIRANPEIVKVLKGRDSKIVRELEEQSGKNIILQADNTLHFEQYNIY